MSGDVAADALVVPSMRAVAAGLGGPVFTFAPQPHLEVFAATPGLASGRVVKMCLSYTFLRIPGRWDDPRNFVDLTLDQAAAIARAEVSRLPEGLKDQIRRVRYPTLFEAVRTSLPIPSERAHPLESRLEAHIVDVLNAMFPGRSHPALSRGARAEPLANHVVQRGVPLLVDEVTCRGFRVDVAPHVIAVGAHIGDRYVTAVIPAPLQSSISLAFATL